MPQELNGLPLQQELRGHVKEVKSTLSDHLDLGHKGVLLDVHEITA